MMNLIVNKFFSADSPSNYYQLLHLNLFDKSLVCLTFTVLIKIKVGVTKKSSKAKVIIF